MGRLFVPIAECVCMVKVKYTVQHSWHGSNFRASGGNINNLLIPHKEDAYFAYSLAIGILNIIGRKLARKV
ncbi:MAG: hypothetical protein ACK5X6_03220 [Chryseotalea sp.]